MSRFEFGLNLIDWEKLSHYLLQIIKIRLVLFKCVYPMSVNLFVDHINCQNNYFQNYILEKLIFIRNWNLADQFWIEIKYFSDDTLIVLFRHCTFGQGQFGIRKDFRHQKHHRPAINQKVNFKLKAALTLKWTNIFKLKLKIIFLWLHIWSVIISYLKIFTKIINWKF